MANNDEAPAALSFTERETRLLDFVLCRIPNANEHGEEEGEREHGNDAGGAVGAPSAHAYLIEGGSGAARLRCAEAAACAPVCTSRAGRGMPCFRCAACKKVLAGAHTDVKIICPERQSGSARAEIRVDTVRAVRKEAYVMPAECDWHVYVFSECEKMNASAQNALLKILEEPPERTLFLLLAPSREMLLPTVVSRVQPCTLGESTPKETAEVLRERFGARVPADALMDTARMQCILDRVELDAAAADTVRQARTAAVDYYAGARGLAAILPDDRQALFLTFGVLAAAARDLAAAKSRADAELYVFHHDEAFEQAMQRISLRRAVELYEAFEKAAGRIQASGNLPSVLMELYLTAGR